MDRQDDKAKVILRNFGIRVRKLRLSRGLSQERLAEACSLHRTYIGMIERGEKNLTISNIYKVSLGLGVSPSELLEGVDDGK